MKYFETLLFILDKTYTGIYIFAQRVAVGLMHLLNIFVSMKTRNFWNRVETLPWKISLAEPDLHEPIFYTS